MELPTKEARVYQLLLSFNTVEQAWNYLIDLFKENIIYLNRTTAIFHHLLINRMNKTEALEYLQTFTFKRLYT